jgi:hypothetical protein
MTDVDMNKPWLQNETATTACHCQCHSQPIGYGFRPSRSKRKDWEGMYYAEEQKCKNYQETMNNYVNLYTASEEKVRVLERKLDDLNKRRYNALVRENPSLILKAHQ